MGPTYMGGERESAPVCSTWEQVTDTRAEDQRKGEHALSREKVNQTKGSEASYATRVSSTEPLQIPEKYS